MSCVTILVTTDPHLSLAPSYSASRPPPPFPPSLPHPGATRSTPGAPRRPQEHPGAPRSTPRSTPGARRSSQEQPGAARSPQEQPGAARSSQEQPGAARSTPGAPRSSQEPAASSHKSWCKNEKNMLFVFLDACGLVFKCVWFAWFRLKLI
jgi:hypothetical protein